MIHSAVQLWAIQLLIKTEHFCARWNNKEVCQLLEQTQRDCCRADNTAVNLTIFPPFGSKSHRKLNHEVHKTNPILEDNYTHRRERGF